MGLLEKRIFLSSSSAHKGGWTKDALEGRQKKGAEEKKRRFGLTTGGVVKRGPAPTMSDFNQKGWELSKGGKEPSRWRPHQEKRQVTLKKG